MLREFVIICATAIVFNSPLHTAAENAPAESELATSVAVKSSKTIKAEQSLSAQPQDNDALPSESSYQSVVPQSVKYLNSPSVSYESNAAVVDTLPGNVPIASNKVSVQSNAPGYAKQPITAVYSTIVASDPVTPENNNILETNPGNTVAIQPYYSVPVVAKTLTINQAASSAYSNNLDPAVRQYYAVPIAAKTVESSNSGNYVTYNQNVNPAVVFANNAAPPKQYYAVPVAGNAVQHVQPNVAFTAQSPALVKYSVNHVVKAPVAQYVTAPRVAYAANPLVKTVHVSPIPVASKKVTVEAYNSVTPHPSPIPITGPTQIRYAPAAIPIAKPIPVPVIYQAFTAETNYPTQQFAAPTTATYIQVPHKAQQRYKTVPIPRVHAESFIEKVYTPVEPTPLTSADSGNSYARAVTYSPASEVSRVTFNGFGASYGW